MALCYPISDDGQIGGEGHANALLVRAAPDLLGASKALLAELLENTFTKDTSKHRLATWVEGVICKDETLQALQAAISKAGGNG